MHVHTQTLMSVHTHRSHSIAYIQYCTLSCSLFHTHAHIHTHTHTHTHTHAHTHTRTYKKCHPLPHYVLLKRGPFLLSFPFSASPLFSLLLPSLSFSVPPSLPPL